jgi:Flp pilus assembly pilin Flp
MAKRGNVRHLLQLWQHDQGQDIAEYAVMLAVILVLVVGTIRLIGSNANNVLLQAASSIQWSAAEQTGTLTVVRYRHHQTNIRVVNKAVFGEASVIAFAS